MGADERDSAEMTSSAIDLRGGHERPIWQAALLAVFLAAIGNSFIYSICYITGVIPWSMLSPGRGVSLNPGLVLSVSVGGVLAGTLIYAALARMVSAPAKLFRWLALVILILSFGAPLSMQGFTWDLTLALDLMHVVVAAATVWSLTIWRRHARS